MLAVVVYVALLVLVAAAIAAELHRYGRGPELNPLWFGGGSWCYCGCHEDAHYPDGCACLYPHKYAHYIQYRREVGY